MSETNKLSKKHRERLNMAATVLAAWVPTPDLKFDLWEWHVRRECGTTCCAVGYLTSQPYFKRRGLRLEEQSPTAWLLDIEFDGLNSWEAVQKFFGLSITDAHHLFSQDEYGPRPTPKGVARRIRAYLKARGESGSAG